MDIFEGLSERQREAVETIDERAELYFKCKDAFNGKKSSE